MARIFPSWATLGGNLYQAYNHVDLWYSQAEARKTEEARVLRSRARGFGVSGAFLSCFYFLAVFVGLSRSQIQAATRPSIDYQYRKYDNSLRLPTTPKRTRCSKRIGVGFKIIHAALESSQPLLSHVVSDGIP